MYPLAVIIFSTLVFLVPWNSSHVAVKFDFNKINVKTKKMKRTTAIPTINPTDNSPLPAPLLTLKTQKASTAFPTGGLCSNGSIRFNINNIIMVNLAKEAFLANSIHKDSPDALNNFLLSLSVTSPFEGGFDAVNAYDKAGISVGFLQFARPEAGVGRLLELTGVPELSDKIKAAFGTKDPHNSPAAMKARFSADLIKEVIVAITTAEGMKAQLQMAVNKNVEGQFYFDKAYSRFLALKLSDPFSCALLFDAAVNMGAGSVSKFPPFTQGSDGDWIAASINMLGRPERKVGWQNILKKNFA